jgi:hypothetical protein
MFWDFARTMALLYGAQRVVDDIEARRFAAEDVARTLVRQQQRPRAVDPMLSWEERDKKRRELEAVTPRISDAEWERLRQGQQESARPATKTPSPWYREDQDGPAP